MKITKDTSPTICPLPFMHSYITANGRSVACCEAQETKLNHSKETFFDGWNNSNYRELRKQLIQGERPEVCKKCWKNEDLNIPSNRMDSWKHFENNRWGNQLLESTPEGEVTTPPVFLELKTTNLCNLKCRMCHPTSSSRIAEDREIISEFRSISWPDKILSSQKTIEDLLGSEPLLSNLKVLQFSGGEPLISNEQVDLVEKLLDHSPEGIQLRYSTNLTQLSYKNIDYPSLWENFQHVNIKISADGIFDVYDYIRVGGRFEKLVENMERLAELNLSNLTINLGFTTQAYNVFQLPEFLKFFENHMPLQAISYPLLHTPEIMSLRALAPEFREKVLLKLKACSYDTDAAEKALEREDFDPTLWNQLLQYTKKMESKYGVEKGFEILMNKYLDGY